LGLRAAPGLTTRPKQARATHPTEASAGNAPDRDVALEAHGTSCADVNAGFQDATPNTGTPQRHVARATRRRNIGGEMTRGTVDRCRTTDELAW